MKAEFRVRAGAIGAHHQNLSQPQEVGNRQGN